MHWLISLLQQQQDFGDLQVLIWLMYGGLLQGTSESLQVLGRHQSMIGNLAAYLPLCARPALQDRLVLLQPRIEFLC